MMFLKAASNFIKWAPKSICKPGNVLSTATLSQASGQVDYVRCLRTALSDTALVGTRGNVVIGQLSKPGYPVVLSDTRQFFRQDKNGFLELLKTKTVSPGLEPLNTFGRHYPVYPNHGGGIRRCDSFPDGTYKSVVKTDVDRLTICGRRGAQDHVKLDIYDCSNRTFKTIKEF